MKDLLDKPALDTILRSTWTKFIDKKKLIAFTLKQVRDADFPTASSPASEKQTGFQITISRLELMKAGFLIWAEFQVPTQEGTCIGTAEIFLTLQGEIQPGNTIGQILTYS